MRILWIPHAGWHIPQRAHVFCRALAERHDVHVTDWVADFGGLRDYFSPRYLRNFLYRRSVDGRITVHGIPRVSPALFSPALRRFNAAVFAWYVERLIEGYRPDAVVSTFVVPPPRASRLVFDLFDENVAGWRASGQAAYAGEIEQAEREYLRVADAVVVSSSVLADKARAMGVSGPLHLIPNAVDVSRFDGRAPGALARAGGQTRLAGTVANHDKAAELDKVLEAARLLAPEDVQFLIAGRGAAMPAACRRAQREGLSNVTFRGYVPPDQVPSVVSSLDVGLCPYLKTPMDDARSPMRLLMYSAAGLPSVCTDLEEVRRMCFPNVVLVGDDGPALAQGIRQALRLERARPAEIQEYDVHRLVGRWEEVLGAR